MYHKNLSLEENLSISGISSLHTQANYRKHDISIFEIEKNMHFKHNEPIILPELIQLPSSRLKQPYIDFCNNYHMLCPTNGTVAYVKENIKNILFSVGYKSSDNQNFYRQCPVKIHSGNTCIVTSKPKNSDNHTLTLPNEIYDYIYSNDLLVDMQNRPIFPTEIRLITDAHRDTYISFMEYYGIDYRIDASIEWLSQRIHNSLLSLGYIKVDNFYHRLKPIVINQVQKDTLNHSGNIIIPNRLSLDILSSKNSATEFITQYGLVHKLSSSDNKNIISNISHFLAINGYMLDVENKSYIRMSSTPLVVESTFDYVIPEKKNNNNNFQMLFSFMENPEVYDITYETLQYLTTIDTTNWGGGQDININQLTEFIVRNSLSSCRRQSDPTSRRLDVDNFNSIIQQSKINPITKNMANALAIFYFVSTLEVKDFPEIFNYLHNKSILLINKDDHPLIITNNILQFLLKKFNIKARSFHLEMQHKSNEIEITSLLKEITLQHESTTHMLINETEHASIRRLIDDLLLINPNITNETISILINMKQNNLYYPFVRSLYPLGGDIRSKLYTLLTGVRLGHYYNISTCRKQHDPILSATEWKLELTSDTELTNDDNNFNSLSQDLNNLVTRFNTIINLKSKYYNALKDIYEKITSDKNINLYKILSTEQHPLELYIHALIKTPEEKISGLFHGIGMSIPNSLYSQTYEDYVLNNIDNYINIISRTKNITPLNINDLVYSTVSSDTNILSKMDEKEFYTKLELYTDDEIIYTFGISHNYRSRNDLLKNTYNYLTKDHFFLYDLITDNCINKEKILSIQSENEPHNNTIQKPYLAYGNIFKYHIYELSELNFNIKPELGLLSDPFNPDTPINIIYINGLYNVMNIMSFKIPTLNSEIQSILSKLNIIITSYINKDPLLIKDSIFSQFIPHDAQSISKLTKNIENYIYTQPFHIRQQVINILLLIFNTTMYIRNWKGPGTPYPILACQTSSGWDIIDHQTTDLNLTLGCPSLETTPLTLRVQDSLIETATSGQLDNVNIHINLINEAINTLSTEDKYILFLLEQLPCVDYSLISKSLNVGSERNNKSPPINNQEITFSPNVGTSCIPISTEQLLSTNFISVISDIKKIDQHKRKSIRMWSKSLATSAYYYSLTLVNYQIPNFYPYEMDEIA